MILHRLYWLSRENPQFVYNFKNQNMIMLYWFQIAVK